MYWKATKCLQKRVQFGFVLNVMLTFLHWLVSWLFSADASCFQNGGRLFPTWQHRVKLKMSFVSLFGTGYVWKLGKALTKCALFNWYSFPPNFIISNFNWCQESHWTLEMLQCLVIRTKYRYIFCMLPVYSVTDSNPV